MDKVGDLLIRIKNGYMASLKEVNVKYSKLSLAILELLKKEGYVSDFKVDSNQILVTLKYQGRTPSMSDVKRISKPGRRIYQNRSNLPYVLDGAGIAIISTPKGVMSDRQARKEGVGGEVMAFIW